MKYPLGLQNISLENSLAVFPNPATSELNIKFNAPANEKVTISLVDMLGREVANIPASAAAGEQVVTMNTNSVARGVYMLRLQSGSETTTRKVSIQ